MQIGCMNRQLHSSPSDIIMGWRRRPGCPPHLDWWWHRGTLFSIRAEWSGP